MLWSPPSAVHNRFLPITEIQYIWYTFLVERQGEEMTKDTLVYVLYVEVEGRNLYLEKIETDK